MYMAVIPNDRKLFVLLSCQDIYLAWADWTETQQLCSITCKQRMYVIRGFCDIGGPATMYCIAQGLSKADTPAQQAATWERNQTYVDKW